MLTVDQHDKWKRFGLWLHIGLDPFPGRIAWLKIWWTNRNPRLVTSYYLNASRAVGGKLISLLKCVTNLPFLQAFLSLRRVIAAVKIMEWLIVTLSFAIALIHLCQLRYSIGFVLIKIMSSLKQPGLSSDDSSHLVLRTSSITVLIVASMTQQIPLKSMCCDVLMGLPR